MTAPNVAPGSVIAGRFSVRSLLGYGGATATFRAVTAQARDVALKLYSPVIGQRPDAMQHLQRYVAETNRLPPELAAHILEAGYDPAFVQTQVGHAYASVTGLYTSVGNDFKQKTIQHMIASRLDGHGRKQDGDADG